MDERNLLVFGDKKLFFRLISDWDYCALITGGSNSKELDIFQLWSHNPPGIAPPLYITHMATRPKNN